jgi:hypothetical protein
MLRTHDPKTTLRAQARLRLRELDNERARILSCFPDLRRVVYGPGGHRSVCLGASRRPTQSSSRRLGVPWRGDVTRH